MGFVYRGRPFAGTVLFSLEMTMDWGFLNGEWLAALGSLAGGGALGGLVSAVVNRKENRRVKRSEAARAEAEALREDASAAMEMMGVLERTVEHMERMNSYNEANSKNLLKMVRDRDAANDQLKRDLELLRLQRAEDHRRVTGLEKTVERELAWRRESDYFYCSVKECSGRKPPLGTLKREVPRS